MFLTHDLERADRLKPGETFNFSCRKGLACFNRCCRKKHLPLTPYDVVRLRKALNLHSDDFLARYAVFRIDADSGFPILSLKMLEKGENLCPFVSSEGCGVYNDRPSACRLFPLGWSAGVGGANGEWEEFYFLQEIPGCLGGKEPAAQRLESWLEGQGLGPYVRMNRKMGDLLFHPKRDSKRPLDERQLQKVMVACFNPDVFREFVATPGFLSRYPLDEETIGRVKQDDEALLTLGFAYLSRALFP